MIDFQEIELVWNIQCELIMSINKKANWKKQNYFSSFIFSYKGKINIIINFFLISFY